LIRIATHKGGQSAVTDFADHPAVEFRKKQTQQLAMILQCAKGFRLVAPDDRGVPTTSLNMIAASSRVGLLAGVSDEVGNGLPFP
jgi:hypothetical protein